MTGGNIDMPFTQGNENRSEIRRAELWLLVVMLVWAANYPLAKFALERLNPFIFNSIRFIVAAAILALPFLRSERHWLRVGREDIPKLFRAGFVANVVYQIFFIIGLSMTTAGNSAVLLSTSPLWTVFLNARLHKEKIQPMMWGGMLISLTGVVLIVVGSGKKFGFGGQEFFGDVIALVAAALWGLNTNLQKPLLVRYSPLQLALIMVSIGAVGLTLTAIPSAVMLNWTTVSWQAVLAAVLSGAFSIGIANTIWSNGVRRLGPGRTANFNNLVPVLAFIISYFTLHEELLPIQFAGAAVTIVGVWIARR